MLKIRLVRAGRKGQPHYRLVVAEHSAPIKGKFVEKLGSYNPAGKTLEFNAERVQHWISNGAKPSDSVARLLKKNNIEGMDKYIKFVTFKKNEEVVTEESAPETAAPEATEEAAAPAAQEEAEKASE